MILHVLIAMVAGWLQRHQPQVIIYLLAAKPCAEGPTQWPSAPAHGHGTPPSGGARPSPWASASQRGNVLKVERDRDGCPPGALLGNVRDQEVVHDLQRRPWSALAERVNRHTRSTTPRDPTLHGSAYRPPHGKFAPRVPQPWVPACGEAHERCHGPNARGMRETARVLRRRTAPGRRALQQHAALLTAVHTALRHTLHPAQRVGDMEQAGEADMDAMGSLVGSQRHPRWRWHASAHYMGAVVASVCGRRQAEVLLRLQAWRESLGLPLFDTAHWGTSTRPRAPDVHSPGPRTPHKSARPPRT
jgi:hypothetical protein